MQSVALGWLVLELTDSAFIVGVVAALGALPILTLTLWGGLIAGRVNKRRALLLLQAGMMVDALVLAGLTLSQQVTSGWIMALAVLHGTLAAFEIPIRQAFLFDLVGRDDLMSAIALNSSAFNLSRVFGPALAGGVLATAGAAVCFMTNAVSFLAVIVALAKIEILLKDQRVLDRPQPAFIDGLNYIRGSRRVRVLMALTAVLGLFGAAVIALLPVYARDALGTGAGGYGGLSAAFGTGAASGALLVAARSGASSEGRGRLAVTAAFGLGLALLVLALSRWYSLALVGLVAAGLSMALNAIMTNSSLQLEAPDELRGQIVGMYALVVVGVAPLGAIPAGWIADRIGLPVTMGSGAIVCLLAALLASRPKAGLLMESPRDGTTT